MNKFFAAGTDSNTAARRRQLARMVGLLFAGMGSAFAQQDQAASADEPALSPIDAITVTGSRLRVDGFAAPTPLLVLTEEDVDRVVPVNVSEVLAQMPQFSSSSQPATATTYANLRSLGAERTLVLLDGRRHVPTFSSGVVDLATIPTSLIARTELVTGGASASWGSDAVAGVVNIILKDDLEGLRGNVQYGRSRYNDDEAYTVSVAGGLPFQDGRGHALFGAEYAEARGIGSYTYPHVSRPAVAARGFVTNSDFSTGLPQFIYSDDVRRANLHEGGVITGGPLRGTTFLPGGETGEFEYGDVFGNLMIGGGSNEFHTTDVGGNVRTPYERVAFLGRVSYDLTPSFDGFLEFNYSESISRGDSIQINSTGSSASSGGCERTARSGPATGNINVSIDNAFLPEHVREAMLDAGINCFNFGRQYREEGLGMFGTADGSPSIYRYVAGFAGELGGDWAIDGYVQYGDAKFQQRRVGNVHLGRHAAAIDAVVDPVSGDIVCRINVDGNSATDDPNCRPFNLFGAGSPSPEAIQYITGTSWLEQSIEQTVLALNAQGNLFDLWAGPISAAVGVEYRDEKIFATVDEDSDQNGWWTSNRKGIEGSYNVKELYGEVLLPLINGRTFAESIDLTVASRITDYSSSGSVTTWKVGAGWVLNDQLRFRATRSRDIRAGNLGELFTPTAVSLQNVVHPLTGAAASSTQVTTSGNPELDPEKANTFTAGFVVSPDIVPGLQVSVDYFSIDIDGQIGTLNGQGIADQCFLHDLQQFCDRLTIDAEGQIIAVNNSFSNLNRYQTSGLDMVFAYTADIGPGELRLRTIGTYVAEHKETFVQDGSVQNSVGQFQLPRWKAFINAGYAQGNFFGGVDWRWYSGGKINNDRIEGFAGVGGANVNNLPSVHYTSLNLGYDLSGLATAVDAELYVRVDNLFDKRAPFPLKSAFNDNFGRGYRGGVRFQF